MGKYKAFLTDLDDTLIISNQVYDEALHVAAKFLSDKFGLNDGNFYELAQEKYRMIARNFPTVHTRHSRILLFRMALDEVVGSGKYDIGLLPEVEDLYWDYFLEHVEVYPEVVSTLQELKDAGIKSAIVSDGDLSLRIRKAKSSGLLQYVDQLVASEEVIFEKPFSAIFTLALSRLNVDPHEAILLGNNYKNDIRGAQMVGIRAGVFIPDKFANPEGQDGTVEPDFEINNFSEVLKEFGIEYLISKC
jgi:putative hydrolase of the HAD superfamily